MESITAFSEVGYERLDGPPGEVVVECVEARVPFVVTLLRRRIGTAVLMLEAIVLK